MAFAVFVAFKICINHFKKLFDPNAVQINFWERNRHWFHKWCIVFFPKLTIQLFLNLKKKCTKIMKFLEKLLQIFPWLKNTIISKNYFINTFLYHLIFKYVLYRVLKFLKNVKMLGHALWSLIQLRLLLKRIELLFD